MGNKEEIIRKLYNTYKFIEEDISKFREIPCLSDVKDFKDGVRKLSDCVAKEVANYGFIDAFKKVVQISGIDKAFVIFYLMSEETGYEIKDEDVIALANIEEYKESCDTFIKQYFIKNANDLDARGMANELLKRVLTVRLNSKKKQKSVSSNAIEVIKSAKELDNVIPKGIEERRVDGNMPNDNKYNIIAYKSIDANHSLIDKAIAELSEKEQKLIERKGRISLGVFDKLLTPEEEESLKSILNKIRSKLGLETIQHEEPQEKKKEKKPKKRGRKPLSIYVLVPVSKYVLDQYLTEELTNEELEIINTREKLIQENRFDEIPKSYKAITNRIVLKARNKLMSKNGIIEKTEKKLRKQEKLEESPKRGGSKKELYEFFPSYSKEEVDRLMEKLPDDDKEIIKAKCEGKELPKADLTRFYRLIQELRNGIIPTPRKRRNKGECTIIETREGKGTHPKHSIFTLIPVDSEVLYEYMESNLDEEEKNIIKTRERIINEGSSERIAQRAADKFARIIQKIKEQLIPEEDREEAYKNRRKEIRTSIYERFKLFSKEEIDAEIANLSDEEKELIEKAENGEKLSREEQGKLRRINSKIEKSLYIMRIKEEKLPISREKLEEELKQPRETVNQVIENEKKWQGITPEEKYEDEIRLSSFYIQLLAKAVKSTKIAEEVDIMDLAMTCFRYGICEGVQKRTCEDIAKYFESDPETVEEVTSKVLEKLYNVIVDSLENNNTNSGKVIVKIEREANEE